MARKFFRHKRTKRLAYVRYHVGGGRVSLYDWALNAFLGVWHWRDLPSYFNEV